MNLKFLQVVARRAGFLVVRNENYGARYLKYPPRGPFDEVLLRTFPSIQDLRFIQIGANDGLIGDPLYRYINECSWTGLLIEPMSKPFHKLQDAYSRNPRLKLINKAVAEHSGRQRIYHFKEKFPGLPDWTDALPSLSRERLDVAAAELGLSPNEIDSTEIDTMTWDNVWSEFGQAQCDLLVTDTEGYDIKLLRLAGLSVRRPRVILFEHSCVDAHERWGFCSELSDLGYEMSTSAGDTIAWLPQP